MIRFPFSAVAFLGASLLLAALSGCSSATDNATSTPAAASSTVYALTQTPGTLWPNLKVGLNVAAGKTISHLTYTYAVDGNMLLSAAGFGYNLEYNSLWSANQTAPAKPNTWTTTADLATLTWGSSSTAFAGAAGQGADLNAWYSGSAACTLYVKQIDVTYSDASTETITFTKTTATPVHVVATSGTTDVAFSDRFWVSDWTSGTGAADLSSGLTQGVVTVAF
jgi:hypothetical protein